MLQCLQEIVSITSSLPASYNLSKSCLFIQIIYLFVRIETRNLKVHLVWCLRRKFTNHSSLMELMWKVTTIVDVVVDANLLTSNHFHFDSSDSFKN